MTAPEIIAYAVVALASLALWAWSWNWTILALIGSFFAAHLVWVLTGECPLAVSIVCDYAVMVSLLLKVEGRDCSPLGGLWGQIKPCWTELSRYDRGVLLLFAPAWAAYATESAQLQYWILWGVGLLQFLVAGAESFAGWRKGLTARATKATPAEPFLRLGIAVNEC